jgi:ATP-binding cassette, subfamily C, bacterial LapB
VYHRLDIELADAIEVIGTISPDSIVEAVKRLARENDLPDPGGLFQTLPLDSKGRLPFHQAENALELAGLEAAPLAANRLPKKARDLPALIRLHDDSVAIAYEAAKDQMLVWKPGAADPVWTDMAELESDYVGQAIRVSGNANRLRSADEGWIKSARDNWFWGELSKMQRDFYPVFGAAFLINILAFALPLFSMNVYDRIIPNRAASSLWVLAIGVLLAFAIEFALRLARSNLLDELGRKLDLKLSEKIFGKLVNLPLADRSGDTGRLVRRVSEFEIVRDFFASTTAVLLVDLVFLVVFVALIAVLAGWLAMVPLVIIAIMFFAGMILQRKMTSATLDAQADAGLQHSLLVEAIGGSETLKANAAEGRMIGRWRNLARMSAQTQERLRQLSATAVTLASICQQLTSIALVIGGFYMFDAGKISMGAIIAIVMLAGRSLAPAGQLAFLMTRGRQAMTVLDSLGALMAKEDERSFGSKSVIPTVRDGHIKLEDATFAYPQSSREALSGINLEIKPGEKIAIIGRVASGKSTLGRLICGLYYPDGGAVLVDGLDNRQYRPIDLRTQLRFVGQDAELFSGSIKDNLLMGAPNADDDALIDALRRVGADEFLGRDDGGFDRGTGERGRNLSGGQRGFLVLARALAAPSKLLFLDEPTGAMDMRTEATFVERLKTAVYPGQTLIVSTHRHAVLSLCDRLIVMDRGRIVADGPRDQIMQQAAAKGAAS